MWRLCSLITLLEGRSSHSHFVSGHSDGLQSMTKQELEALKLRSQEKRV